MIVYKYWMSTKQETIFSYRKTWEGWFLFGFIPLYVRLVKSEKY